MSLRSFLVFGALACTAACGGSGGAEVSGAFAPGGQVVSATLSVQGKAQLNVVAGTTQTLQVLYARLDDAPLSDEDVEFGLVGATDGASLQAARASTDADGIAEMVLVAGATVASFQVRASAAGAVAQFFDIDVVEAQHPTLTLQVTYDGQRPIETRSVALLDNMKCEQLQMGGNGADVKVSYMVSAPEQTIEYKEPLGAGRSYAVVAWGSDSTNSKLALGCEEFKAPVTGDADKAALVVEVPLQNVTLDLADHYDVSLSVNAQAPLAALTARTRSFVRSSLPSGATPQATFLLDLLTSKADFALMRQSLQLDAALEASLTQSNTGPLRLAEAWAGRVADAGGTCSIEGQLVTPAASGAGFGFQVGHVLAIRGGTVAKEIDSSMAPLHGAVSVSASYSAERAAIDVQALKVPFGFGGYAVYLLNEAASATSMQGSPDMPAPALSDASGCDQLQSFVAAQTAVFGAQLAGQVAELCAAAVETLRKQVVADWMTLDAMRDSFQVSGSIFVHDRDGEGTVDDLGPASLSGDWAATGSTSSDTKIDATLRVTPKSTLAI